MPGRGKEGGQERGGLTPRPALWLWHLNTTTSCDFPNCERIPFAAGLLKFNSIPFVGLSTWRA